MIKGQVAVVTGASSGIGYATALAIAKAGAKVAAGARRVERLEHSTRNNIRVTTIEPGIVDTELTNTITDKSLESFVKHSKSIQALKSEDIASSILFALESPPHMNVNEITIRPTAQER